MIRVKTLYIEEFRGIRKLDLDLEGKNFGICGPNGTGKSGVVDAIEFCLTGDVTRLSGEGSGDLSVKAHAPHVDQHDHPENAKVTITADIPSLGKTVTLSRTVKNPRKVTVKPADASLTAVVKELEAHPEFALSRREIVKYIITSPGHRSEDVQTLLRLDHLEKLRKALTAFCNRRSGAADEANRARVKAEADLKNALQIDHLDRALVLKIVNEKRKALGLEEFAELTADVSFTAGVPAATQEGQQKASVSKAAALADLSALQTSVKSEEPPDLAAHRSAAKAILDQFKADAEAFTHLRRHGLIKAGLELVSEDACPLCDKAWDAEELRLYLRKKLLTAEETGALMEKLRAHVDAVLQALSVRAQGVERCIQYCGIFNPPVPHDELTAYYQQLNNIDFALSALLEDPSGIDAALDALAAAWWQPEAAPQARIDQSHASAAALPDVSAEDAIRAFLTVAQDRYGRLRDAAKTAKEQAALSAVAQKVLDHYNKSCTSVLEGIYDVVAKDFTKYYCIINREDEANFVGELKAAPAKLNFNVDFFGRGVFPPGAYHSEGHQDGMGLCLYLALMKHTLGDRFTFAVLDDVLMSVDTGHRREVCRLLKGEFPKTQFILTTHDRVWLQYMKTEHLIERSQLFGGWTVDGGPRIWDDQDIWAEIEGELAKNDVAKAAFLLRRYLEYTATILADNLRAEVEFRGDGQYDLGEMMPQVLKEWRKRLEDGEKSAAHWKRDDVKAALAEARAKAKDLIAKTKAEEWAINPSVHFNQWANLAGSEFKEVVDAFKNLLETMRCDNVKCKSYLYVLPRKGKSEEMRCNCGARSINLKMKP